MSDATDPARGFRFDPTINLGHILTATVLVGSIAGFAYVGDYRLSAVEKGLANLGTLVIEQAKVGERLVDHGRRIDRLESWREGMTGQPKVPAWTPP